MPHTQQDLPAKPTATSPAIDDATAGWKTYRNEEFGFGVQYPPTWIVTEKRVTEGSSSLYISNFELDFTEQYFLLPERDSTYIWISVDAVDVRRYPYIREDFEKREKSFLLDGARTTRVEHENIGKVNTSPDYKPRRETGKAVTITTIKDDTHYIIELVPFDTPYVALFNQILSTFRFLD